eukprot:TRINITY_DN1666_c0_g1_i1.p3 TRINITY_DN1666_c0_g1~~TRINITY_DN1666_c0_g1_i1.p3  ORF type:complete len:186 (-),score=61.32 TRINITY_DN1666_c0_g1_i1:1650-2207(-)
MLICFGEIAFLKHEEMKIPENLHKEEDKEMDPLLAKLAKRQQAKKEREAKEDAPKPVQVTFLDTSIHDFLQAVEKMQDYDYTLFKLGILKADLQLEINQKEEKASVEEVKKEEVKEEVKKVSTEKNEEEDIFGGESDEEQDGRSGRRKEKRQSRKAGRSRKGHQKGRDQTSSQDSGNPTSVFEGY